jgi:predicted phosphodiesterase
MSIIAVLCADIHLSHTPPVARSVEPDWYTAQERILEQLVVLARDNKVPIYVAGDIFDRWNPPVELVNFLIEFIKEREAVIHAIPGQHDLPYHDKNQVFKSAYRTLVLSGVVSTLTPGVFSDRANVMGAHYDEIPKLSKKVKKGLNVAVCHKYVWMNSDNSYPGAPVEGSVKTLAKKLKGFDVAIFGDNHIGFDCKVGDITIYNCGCLIPRKMDERRTKPSVGFLYENGTVTREYLDTSKDLWIDVEDAINPEVVGMRDFIDGLKNLESDSFDFREEVERYIADNKVERRVADLVLESMGK